MAKLGPENIRGGKERDMDRKLANSLFSLSVRLCLRDIATLQAETLVLNCRLVYLFMDSLAKKEIE